MRAFWSMLPSSVGEAVDLAERDQKRGGASEVEIRSFPLPARSRRLPQGFPREGSGSTPRRCQKLAKNQTQGQNKPCRTSSEGPGILLKDGVEQIFELVGRPAESRLEAPRGVARRGAPTCAGDTLCFELRCPSPSRCTGRTPPTIRHAAMGRQRERESVCEGVSE